MTPVQLPSFTSFNRYNEFALYANDNWSVGNRLKLNLGLRYEYLRAAEEERAEVRLQLLLRRPERLGEHRHAATEIIDAVRSGRRCRRTRARSARCGSPTGTTSRRASGSRGT